MNSLILNSADDKILDAVEIAIYIKKPISSVRYLVFMKRIPHIKIGRSVRFSKYEIDCWLAAQKVSVKS